MTNSIEKIGPNNVQIHYFSSQIKMTKGQIGLLKILRDCVGNNKPITFDIIVKCYYENVRKYHTDWNWVGEGSERKQQWTDFNIMDEYIKFIDNGNNPEYGLWQYKIRPKIRQWFVSTIGILVMKNQLVIIPTIEIE